MSDVDALGRVGADGGRAPDERPGGGCACRICRTSRPDRSGPRVMFGTKAEPDESLIGLVLRASANNHVERTVTIIKAASRVAHAHVNLAIRCDVDFAQLAWATRVAPHDIEARRYAAVGITPELPGVMFHGASVPAYDLRLRSRRLAPAWLSDPLRHSALGHHGLVTHCPVSRDVLIDRCPRCDAALTWSATSIAHCRACGFDLRHHSAEKVSEAMRNASALMVDLVHPHSARSAEAAASLPEVLRHLDRGTVFELGWRLGCLITGTGDGSRDVAWKLPVVTRLGILAAGSRALESWPDGLHAAIAGHAGRRGGRGAATVVDDLRKHLLARNVPAELKRVVIQAMPALSISKAAAVKSVIGDGVNSAEATRALGVGQRVFERLAQAGALRVVLDSGSVNRHRVIDGGALAPLAARIADRVSIGTVSQELGISRHGVEQLCCLGAVEFFHGKAMRSAFADAQVRRSDCEALADGIERAALSWHALDEDADTIALHRAVTGIGGREKPWGLILNAMRDGTLPFWLTRAKANGGLVSRVVLAVRDVPTIGAMTFLRELHPGFRFEGQIKRQDAEELLNLNPARFQQALAAGELKSGRNRLYDLGAVLPLAETMISGGEIMSRWAGNGRRMPAPFRGREGLKRVRHLGWDRGAVETTMATLAVRHDVVEVAAWTR